MEREDTLVIRRDILKWEWCCQNGPNKRMVSVFLHIVEGIEKDSITLGNSFVVSYEFKHDLALCFVAQGENVLLKFGFEHSY